MPTRRQIVIGAAARRWGRLAYRCDSVIRAVEPVVIIRMRKTVVGTTPSAMPVGAQ